MRLGGVIGLCFFYASAAWSFSYHYEKQRVDKQVVHVVTLDPKKCVAKLVKAQAKGGRETVATIAERSGAEIAINGGFFKIGGEDAGKPTGTLVIDGHSYKLKNHVQALLVIDSGKITIKKANPKTLLASPVSMLSGIPLLVQQGEVVPSVSQKKSLFYAKPHARTAIGLRKDGTIVLVVVEKEYWKFFLSSIESGLTLPALAQLMRTLGCQTALNLDGGGSSTLWIRGKVINQTIGDGDEGEGKYLLRAVSDALIFKAL